MIVKTKLIKIVPRKLLFYKNDTYLTNILTDNLSSLLTNNIKYKLLSIRALVKIVIPNTIKKL